MYKVFIEDRLLKLGSEAEKNSIAYEGSAQLQRLIEDLEKSRSNEVLLYSENLETLWSDFRSFYTLVEAAGGLVYNAMGELLMIYRLGRWDLPKGKIEEGELPLQCAQREVAEECGIPESELEVREHLLQTYHCYHLGASRILKRTYWYRMRVAGRPHIHPQREEGIEYVQWCSPVEVVENLQNTYANIKLACAAAEAKNTP